jgi:hypothetical protein
MSGRRTELGERVVDRDLCNVGGVGHLSSLIGARVVPHAPKMGATRRWQVVIASRRGSISYSYRSDRMSDAGMRARVVRLLEGRSTADDLTRLFLFARDSCDGREAIQEIGDFVAHAGERNKGLLTRAARDWFWSHVSSRSPVALRFWLGHSEIAAAHRTVAVGYTAPRPTARMSDSNEESHQAAESDRR